MSDDFEYTLVVKDKLSGVMGSIEYVELEINSCEFFPKKVCGDGILGCKEECDDGNLYSGDGCSKYCKIDCGCIC